MAEGTISIIAAITAITINSGALISFWAWARARISTHTAELNRLMEWRASIDLKCIERRQDIQGIYEKVDEVKQCIANEDKATARALGEINGRLTSIFKQTVINNGIVRT